MPRAAEAAPLATRADLTAAKRGLYLHDAERLYRVVDTARGELLLEDAAAPQKPAQWLSVADVLAAGMRLVRQ